MFFDNINADILTVLHINQPKKRAVSPDRHFHALSFRVSGDSVFKHEDKSWHVKTSDIIFIPKMYKYEINTLCDEELYCIHFDMPNLSQTEIEVFSPANPSVFENFFSSASRIWKSKSLGYQFATLSVLYKILEALKVDYAERNVFSSLESFKAAIDYMNINYTHPDLSVATLAKTANMSETYFRRLFAKTFSTTPKKYIHNLRIEYAKELLESGYYSMQQVSEKCGFSDPKYFSTSMKAALGVSPSEYSKTRG